VADTSITLGIESTRQTWFREQFGWLTTHPPYLWQVQAFEALLENQIPSALALPTGSGKTSLMPIWRSLWAADEFVSVLESAKEKPPGATNDRATPQVGPPVFPSARL
jgi:hypothetical protein